MGVPRFLQSLIGVERRPNMPPAKHFVVQIEKFPDGEKMSSGALFLGIGDGGVSFCDANKQPQIEFKYKQISSWAATKTNFAFVTGDIKAQKKYVFKTDQGQEVSDMLRGRVNEVYGKML